MEQNKPWSMFERLRNVFHQESKPRIEIEIKQEHRAVVPFVFQPKATVTHAELLTEFCSGCREIPELLATHNNLALLGCSKARCEHRLFRMDTLN